ncbi:MAG: C25 family cysteine peptidase [bacterium]
MKKTIFSLIFLVITFTVSGSHWVAIQSQQPGPAMTQLASSTVESSVVHFTLNGFTLSDVNTPKGVANVVSVENATPILEGGAPDLPKVTASVIIPDLAGMSIRVINSSFRDFVNIEVAPSRGMMMRDTDPSTVPYYYGKSYETDQFFPGKVADTRTPYIVRDFRGQTIIVYPFQYNPFTKTLRVYYDLTVELYKSAETGLNPFYRPAGETRILSDFRQVYENQFINSNSQLPDYTPVGEYGRILVISHGPFMNDMQPYVNWKMSIGYPIEMVDVSTIGTSASVIKTYIANYFTEHPDLAFVLLVGDIAQIPTNQGGSLGGPSDNAYGYLVGSDHYSDVFVGRFSAENVGHVQTQVQRSLQYEMNPQLRTDDWYSTVIGIASQEGPGDNNEYDYQHVRNQQTKLLDYTYTLNPELFEGSQGGNDATGNPSSTQVATAINEGASLIIYCGHGSTTSWGTSGFNNTQVNNLTNQGKLPFIWSVACVNGEFMNGTCFAEAWMRASKNGEPTGAIAFLGATINQSWDPPMAGQDDMTDILIETYPGNIKRTFAGLSINGCMKMIDQYGTGGADMADTWVVFGDPSIIVRTSNPDTMQVSHASSFMAGDSSITVQCNVEGARVTATLNDTILATALISGGTCTLTFPALENDGDTVHLIVYYYNNIPYIAAVPVQGSAPLAASFTGDATTIYEFETIHFTDGSTGGASSWQWTFPGGTPSTSSEQNPSVVYENDGTFDVQLIVGNGSTYDTLTRIEYIHVDFPSSLCDEKQPFSCKVSPNPGNGNLMVSLTNCKAEQVSIQVYNMIGNSVYLESNVPVSGSLKKALNLSVMQQGIYFLKIMAGETTLTQKIVIQK